MSIIVWSASATVATSIPLVFWALADDRASQHRASENLAGQNPTMRQTVLQQSAIERIVLPLTRRVGSRLVRFTPIGWAERRNRALAKAGLSGRVTAEQILGAKLMVPALLLALLGLGLVGDVQPRTIVIMVVSMAVGFFAPDIMVRAAADRRAEAITQAYEKTIAQKVMTYDFERQTEGATKVGTSGFATAIIENI